MTRLKRGLAYFGFTMTSIAILLLGVNVHHFLYIVGRRTFNSKLSIMFFLIFSILFGVLLALPQMVIKLKEKGSIRLDWIKIVFIGFPTLLLAILPCLYFYTGIGYLLPVGFLFREDPLSFGVFFFAGVISGYILPSSLDKV